MQCPTMCVLCNSEEEMPRHLFINCIFSRGVWDHFLSKIGHVLCQPLGINQVVKLDIRIGDLIEGKQLFAKHSLY